MVDYHAIGTATPRVDGVEKVTGRALYAGDRRLPGMLAGRLLHSHRPHARILRIDTAAAAALPGVHAVITGEDVRGHLYGRRIKDMPVLADGLVRYFGERIAAVAAEDEETAQRAVDLIEVEFEDLAPVSDVLDAIAPGAPLLHPAYGTYPGTRPLESPSNAYDHTVTERGDLDAAMAAADFVFEGTFSTQRMHQAYLEPHTSLVSVTDGRAHIWTNTKAPHSIREVLTVTLGLTPDEIVLHHSHIGGDFGGKGTPLNLPIAYFLASASGRPVRLVADYVEEFMAGNPRHATLTRLRTGVMRDGTITAHHVDYFVNSGAYAAYQPGGRIGGATRAAGPYRIPNTRIESTHVYTNSVPGGHMRAPGGPQGVFALESHLDAIARELDVDPFEFRMHNLIAEGDEPASGDQITRPWVRETLQAAADAAGYLERKPPHVGRGMAIGDHGVGGGVGNAGVTIHPDGSVTLGTAIFDQGSGTYTALAQVVAEELGVPVERIRLEIWDTDGTGGEDDSGIGGSRATRVNTVAAHAAAQDARAGLVRALAAQLGAGEGDLVMSGALVVTPDGEAQPWADVLAETGQTIIGRSHVDERGPTHMTGFAAQVAEVAVDPETGQVTVLKITSAHDVGRVLNPIATRARSTAA